MSEILQCGARADVRRVVRESLRPPVARQRVAEGAKQGDGAGFGSRAVRPALLNQQGRPLGGGVSILVPKLGKTERWDEWMWRELRGGGRLQAYLDMEKRLSDARLRSVRRQMDDFQQNNRSDFQLKAAVPVREYIRWKKEDPHFWEDDANLRSWRRSNPDAFVKV